jgi:hypothetical protein
MLTGLIIKTRKRLQSLSFSLVIFLKFFTLFCLFLFLFIQVYCPYATLGYERPTPHLLTDTNIHSDTQAEPRELSLLK